MIGTGGHWHDVADVRRAARRALPRMVFDYIEGGAGTEAAVALNEAAFREATLPARRLVDVAERDQAISLFGSVWKSPFAVAPMGLNGVCRPGGDVILAKAAARHGVPFILSTASTSMVEEVTAESQGGVWFQLYVLNREAARSLAKRAWAAGCRTLVLTVDVAVNGDRPRDRRSGFGVPFRYTPRIVADAALHPAWTLRQLLHGLPELAHFRAQGGDGANAAAAQALLMQRKMDASFDWNDLARLRDEWRGTLLVKGILRSDDAVLCEQHGIDGIIVSNHGGRQLEQSVSPLHALDAIAAAVRVPVLMDGGIRTGADVLVALARGASGVLIGRPFLYALAAAGDQGVDRMFAMLRGQLDTALALAGCPRADRAQADLSCGSLSTSTHASR